MLTLPRGSVTLGDELCKICDIFCKPLIMDVAALCCRTPASWNSEKPVASVSRTLDSWNKGKRHDWVNFSGKGQLYLLCLICPSRQVLSKLRVVVEGRVVVRKVFEVTNVLRYIGGGFHLQSERYVAGEVSLNPSANCCK